MNVRLAVFDCDGTLVDSQAGICRAMEETFAVAQLIPPSRAAIRGIVGLSLVEAMAALLPGGGGAQHRALADGYRTTFRALREAGQLDDEPLYDGIADAIDRFCAEGWVLGVATGKSDRGLAHILAVHGLTDRFHTLQTADRHPSKPDPAMIAAAMRDIGADPADTIMIGDTSFDMAMARAAGVRAVGVAWGYHPRDALVAAGADLIVSHPSELAATVVPA